MLRIHDLVFDAWGRRFFDHATVSLPAGAKVGLGRAQRRGQVDPVQADPGPARRRRRRDRLAESRAHRHGGTGTRRDAGPAAGDRARRRPRTRRADGRAGDRGAGAPGRHLFAAERHRRRSRPGPRVGDPGGPRLHHRRSVPADGGVFRRLADAGGHGRGPVRRAGPATARRADQLSRSRRRFVAGGAAAQISAQRPDHQPRPRTARPFGGRHPPPHRGPARLLHRRFLQFREAARREGPAAGRHARQDGGQEGPHAGLRRPLPRLGQQGAPGPVADEDDRQAGGFAARDRGACRPLPAALPAPSRWRRRWCGWRMSRSATTASRC